MDSVTVRSFGSPVAAVRRGLVILSVMWQGLFILSELTSVRGGPLAWWYLSSITATWFLLVGTLRGEAMRIRWHTWAQAINIAMLLGWAITFLLVLPTDGGWQEGASIVTIAVGLVGFLASTRLAVVLVPIIGVTQFLLLAWGTRDLDPVPPLTSDVLYGWYALTIGFIAALARLALLRAAGRAERSQEALVQERIRARAVQDLTAQLDVDERRVHATVLNTLIAFGRGFQLSRADVSRRAHEGLEVLYELIPRERVNPHTSTLGWHAALLEHIEEGRRTGLRIALRERVAHPPPDHVGQAFAQVVGEAISNTVRHAHAHSMDIALIEDDAGAYTLTIEDDGVGLPADHRPGFGMRQGIQRVVGDVGGSVSVDGDDGVTIQARWDQRQQMHPVTERSRDNGILASFATPVIVLMWLLTTVRLVFSLDAYTDIRPVLLAYVLYTGLATAVLVVARRARLRGVWVVGIVIAAPLIYVLQTMGTVVTGATPWASWSSEAVVSLFLVLIGAGPWWAALAVLPMWVVMQGDVIAEIFAPGFVILVAITFFARSVRRNTQAFERSLAERIEVEAAALAARERAAVLGERYQITRIGNAIGLLRGFAQGHLDVNDPAAQAQCLREERLLRSVLGLNPHGSSLDRTIGALAQLAYATNRRLHIDLHARPSSIDEAALHAFSEAVRAVFRSSDPGEEARLSDATVAGRYQLQFVAASQWVPPRVDMRQNAVRTERVDERTVLVEGEVGDASGDHR